MLEIVIGFAAGVLSSMGFGGGSVLLLYLTLLAGEEQKKAAGINLLFFLPCAVLSIVLYFRQKLIDWKIALPLMITAALGAVGGALTAMAVDAGIIRTLFGILLCAVGLKDLFTKDGKKENPRNSAK